MQIQFTSIADEDVESFRESRRDGARTKVLDTLEAPSNANVRGFVAENIGEAGRKSSHATALG